MRREDVTYQAGDKPLYGYLCHNKGISEKRPAIIVAHAWKGLDAFARHETERLASLGYIAMAADVFGLREPVTSDEQASALMMPLFLDRALLQQRITAAFHLLAKHPLVDTTRIGAIGFCFGGLTAIELLRSGVDVRGVVSFHGLLGNKMSGKVASTLPISPKAKGAILVLHGHEDPLVSPDDIASFQKEVSEANIDWQFHVYGHASHAFTNPEAASADKGLLYNETADRRSWLAMTDFFDDIFKF